MKAISKKPIISSVILIDNIWGLPLVTISVKEGAGRDYMIDTTGKYRTD